MSAVAMVSTSHADPKMTPGGHQRHISLFYALAVTTTMLPVCCSFGEVTAGLEMLTKLEGVETFQEGIFVMPKVSTCTLHVSGPCTLYLC